MRTPSKPVKVHRGSTNRDGKVVATWSVAAALRLPTPDGAKSADYWRVTIKLIADADAMTLRAQCPALPLTYTHTDIEVLRQLVEDALTHQVNLLTNAKWSRGSKSL